jgi:hypothetical protein
VPARITKRGRKRKGRQFDAAAPEFAPKNIRP